MAVLYLPPDTTDLGTIQHYGQTFEVRHDADAGLVYLLYPGTDADDTPVAQRAPAIIACCGGGVWAKLTIYCDQQYQLSRTFTDWENELRDAIAILVQRMA
ncbi:hypothetical protein [Salininema proteolyticum]|uniref:Uncharacterized protein n=1 Tax=Salininema proteolyticum TaxID=1607685 RepID=A0ABV8U1T8_9ACTN